MNIYPGIAGKRVLITAAADGMGKTTAQAFIRNAARVHICDIDREKVAAFQQEEPSLGASLTDVSDPAQVNRMFDTIESTLSGLDIVVNNAGIGGPKGPIEDMAIEDWDRTVAINLNGPFYVLKRAVPLIRAAGGGSIVNISSTAGYLGYPFRTPYAASKFGLIGLTKSLSIELGRDSIRVNAICPGPVTGSRMERAVNEEARVNGITASRRGCAFSSATPAPCHSIQ
jgi:NAD(P)-dependent dehydrogenase (short-subunit alcohol dehydrogenase family)